MGCRRHAQARMVPRMSQCLRSLVSDARAWSAAFREALQKLGWTEGGAAAWPLAAASLAAIFTCALPVAAQDFPTRPITLVVPFPAGGGNDVLARVVAEKMSRTLGQHTGEYGKIFN